MEWTFGNVFTVLGMVGATCTSLGFAARWLLTRIDAKDALAFQRQDAAVAELKATLNEQIERLQRQLERAETELVRMRDEHDVELTIARQERDRWLNQCWLLRTRLQENGIPIPPLGGPEHV